LISKVKKQTIRLVKTHHHFWGEGKTKGNIWLWRRFPVPLNIQWTIVSITNLCNHKQHVSQTKEHTIIHQVQNTVIKQNGCTSTNSKIKTKVKYMISHFIVKARWKERERLLQTHIMVTFSLKRVCHFKLSFKWIQKGNWPWSVWFVSDQVLFLPLSFGFLQVHGC